MGWQASLSRLWISAFPNTEGENDHRTKKFTYPEEEKQYEEQE